MRTKTIWAAAGCIMIAGISAIPAQAFWVWTPETNQWVNPRFTVKETPSGQLAFGMEAFEAGDYKKAAGEMRKLLKYYPKAREAADAQYYLGRILEGQGEYFKAFKTYQTGIEKYPFSDRSKEIVKRQYDIAGLLLDGPGRRNNVMHTIVGGDYDVIEIFRAVIKNDPYGPYAAPAQYKIGLYLEEKQLYQEARDEFEKTVNDYPGSQWAKAAQYRIALADAKRSSEAAYDQKVTQAAITQFRDFIKEHPQAELSKDARRQIQTLREKEAENQFLVARFYEKQQKYDAARVYYSAIVSEYKNTRWAVKALEKLQALSRN